MQKPANNEPRVYIYVVDRDLGFAPNPFNGFCTLATCKPDIRNTAKVGDWIFGFGGGRLKATGKCIFAMKVSKKVSFNEYWTNPKYRDKKPVRNGSKKMMLGDNIYFYDNEGHQWNQAPSHHSLLNGETNIDNLKRDTKSHYVLISYHFYYFGSSAPIVPVQILTEIGYKNKVGHRVFDFALAQKLLMWIEQDYSDSLNKVLADPYNFDKSAAHYSVTTNKIV